MSDMAHPLDYAYPIAPGDVPYWQPGMTLRDYFAGQALAALATRENLDDMCKAGDGDSEIAARVIASVAYDVADAMLAERAK